jgi:hypothetical protein
VQHGSDAAECRNDDSLRRDDQGREPPRLGPELALDLGAQLATERRTAMTVACSPVIITVTFTTLAVRRYRRG